MERLQACYSCSEFHHDSACFLKFSLENIDHKGCDTSVFKLKQHFGECYSILWSKLWCTSHSSIRWASL